MIKLGLNILGIGISKPNFIVKSKDLDNKLGLEDGKIEKTTGLKQRYFIDTETPDDLLKRAIDDLLIKTKIDINEIDCIINASATMSQSIPYNAANTHRLLNLDKPIPSFDINMTCLSFLRSLDISSNLFNSYNKILIVTCDIPSIGLDWKNIRTSGIFGDGATATIVEKSESGGVLTSNFETHSIGFDYCEIKGGGYKLPPSKYEGDYKEVSNFEMDGKKLYKLSSKVLPLFIKNSLNKIDLTISDIDWIVPHQASQSSLNHIIKMLDLDKNKVIDIFNRNGNQVASSIPTVLEELIYKKPIKSGDKVLIVGTSAGIGLGLMIWEIP